MEKVKKGDVKLNDVKTILMGIIFRKRVISKSLFGSQGFKELHVKML